MLVISLSAYSIASATDLTFNGVGSFWCKVQCREKLYSLDDVTVSISFGTYKLTDRSRDARYTLRDYDSFVCFALYFCASDDYKTFKTDTEINDYKNLDGHYFIKSISAEDAFFGYGVLPGIFKTLYQHTERLTIPREVFEAFSDSFCIKMVSIHSKDGKHYLSGLKNYITIQYKILDGEYIQFH